MIEKRIQKKGTLFLNVEMGSCYNHNRFIEEIKKPAACAVGRKDQVMKRKTETPEKRMMYFAAKITMEMNDWNHILNMVAGSILSGRCKYESC